MVQQYFLKNENKYIAHHLLSVNFATQLNILRYLLTLEIEQLSLR